MGLIASPLQVYHLRALYSSNSLDMQQSLDNHECNKKENKRIL